MSLPPETTPVPSGPFAPAMTPAATTTTTTAAPAAGDHADADADEGSDADADAGGVSGDEAFALPKLRLEVRDLNHPGATAFLAAVHAGHALRTAAHNVLRRLYVSPSHPRTTVPPTRSVTLVLRDMPGVAYTTGTELDDDHKEVHLSLRYVRGVSPEARRADEIAGVLTHELVHCFQYHGAGPSRCPGGLVEGVADWVRLRCRLSPPHWRREASGRWDAGYQHTAYFLDYLEGRFGAGTVRALNEKLRTDPYVEARFWTELLGRPVDDLWRDYADKLRDEDTVVVTSDEAAEAREASPAAPR